MSSRPTFRILVVEDVAGWREALAAMYRRIFDKYGKVELTATDNGEEARRELLARSVDLLSCDINLSESGYRDEDGDGRNVLRFASQRRRAAAVIVPTAITSDERLAIVIPQETEVARLTLDVVLEKFFPGRFLRLDKPLDADPVSTTNIWAQHFGEKIVALTQVWPSVRPPYSLLLDGTYYQPRVTIRGTTQETYFVEQSADAEFFYNLADNARVGSPLSEESARKIFADTNAQSAVSTLERRLERAGVDPNRLFERKRKQGWRLMPEVMSEFPGRRQGDDHDADPAFIADRRRTPEEELLHRERDEGDD